jgi:MOSC domain-containing protein YiiM
MTSDPIVLELHIVDAKDKPMESVESVSAVANRGLFGDRYFNGSGHYSNIVGWGAQVTLIQHEAILAINTGYGTDFTGAMMRRNIVTQNIKLDTLIGKTFRCGQAILRGTKPFPPCAHLAYLLGRKEVLKYFAYCGGIGADVVVGGEISIGDTLAFFQTE